MRGKNKMRGAEFIRIEKEKRGRKGNNQSQKTNRSHHKNTLNHRLGPKTKKKEKRKKSKIRNKVLPGKKKKTYTMMLLMGMWINLMKKPMKPIMAKPTAVASAIFWNSALVWWKKNNNNYKNDEKHHRENTTNKQTNK